MYHKFGISKYPSTNVTIEQFERHLEEFNKPKYNLRPLQLVIDSIYRFLLKIWLEFLLK